MINWIDAVQTSEVPDGTMKEVVVRGHSLLITNVGGHYYATRNRCPHHGAKLSNGTLAGTSITCPKHGSKFDLTDGHVIEWAKKLPVISTISMMIKRTHSLETHDVRIDHGSIVVKIDEDNSQVGLPIIPFKGIGYDVEQDNRE